MLQKLAQLCAILAGVLLTFITVMTCISLIGRNTTGMTLAGDFELTGVAAGAAVALFMPWCQLRQGNIIVDFFTAKASAVTNAWLDRFGAALVAAVFALLTWRTGVGALNAYTTQSSSMMLGFPEWVVYFTMIPPFVLTVVIALYQAVTDFAGSSGPAQTDQIDKEVSA
jgi:TRAP-type C4-dicarboxylate transport system permease small subunit